MSILDQEVPFSAGGGGRGMESTRLVGMKRKDEKLFLDRLNKAIKRDSLLVRLLHHPTNVVGYFSRMHATATY